MNIKVYTAPKEQFEHAEPYASCPGEAIQNYYTNILQDACDKQTETVHLQGLPLTEKNSDNFQAMGSMEKAIVEFLRTHEYPRNVEILTDCEEAATMYRIVYNFWFAQEKSSRMADEHWD